jgi:peptide alpha-N-acetyltransferase
MCKQESHRGKTNRGYIGMLSVDKAWRRRGIGESIPTQISDTRAEDLASKLVELAIAEMGACGAHEVRPTFHSRWKHKC